MSKGRGTDVVLLLSLALLAAPAAWAGPMPDQGEGQLSEVLDNGRTMYWRMLVEHEAVVLTVKTPCGPIERVLEPGQEIVFDPAEEVYPDDPDGTYTWQVRIVPVVDSAVRKELQRARNQGDDEAVANLRRKGLLPQGPFLQTGSFTVREGAIVARGEEEKEGARSKVAAVRSAPDVAVAHGGDLEGVTGKTVISGDLTVYNSLCVGFDCASAEGFGSDTIRLKENNLRIHFEDTSAGTFPSRDWRIEINSSTNGGQSHFRLDDATGGTSPFTIEAAAPSHSLYVDSSGRIGRKTANPVLELHIADGDTPGIRLQQDGSSGFQAQTWDIAGNETNFFVRDATGGSTLPFRIRPGAPSSAIDISNDGDVGFGTTSPDAAVDIERAGGGSAVTMLRLTNSNGPSRLEFRDGTNAVDWDFRTTSGDTFVITQPTSPSNDFQINSNGDLVVRGTLTTGGPTCGAGCDAVLRPDFPLESIAEHAARMFANSYLPAVGPTVPHAPMNISEKTGGILNELEKAHLYILELDGRNRQLQQQHAALEAELARLRAVVDQLVAGQAGSPSVP
ncbi:MAG TPA: hypothetical protein VHQ65_14575 [Thermoanaerobaculia bacterium]|nr:hypothetical protein [Thermoanaerobaculia bacterium]